MVYSTIELVVLLLLVLVVAFLVTVLERKVLASGLRRTGPSYCGWFGLVQIAGDGLLWTAIGLLETSSSGSFLVLLA